MLKKHLFNVYLTFNIKVKKILFSKIQINKKRVEIKK